ncbi:SDR family NAD(P)-dependent oxidoreductase [Jannaschia seohaensis]|uniref:NADP-dependent 3-hydroxy acid dehydrogenase YdfG n=1 Tax=Jannaschia seohaensis TaxID=475081 RepID=A0A2Y9ABR7_9RHOB|nr:SDR family NAD(P)-dependent oxidoreductase [Jannaschia seohaensis]PWJ21428.1 NADP-dependent 3-hydroxy acid dehydrogenase YdfG [Jannaschia seohaensis]SSA42034.1 NADP-dependent 3-hydroxy acid dehydrogenase YdfG [Jannaschia seohaensis]
MDKPHAVIIGVGDGLSASVARELAQDHTLTLAARSPDKMRDLAAETGAETVLLDATDEAGVAALFDALPRPPRVVVYNPSMRVRGPVAELDADEVRRAVEVTAIGAFLAGKHAARRMLDTEPVDGCRGTILFTGASAGVKGFPQSAPFAMGKFAQRGLAESMARELHPKGIHVAWINIDGAILNPGVSEPADRPGSKLRPEAIARTYRHLIEQDRSAWTHEIAVRPWVETF